MENSIPVSQPKSLSRAVVYYFLAYFGAFASTLWVFGQAFSDTINKPNPLPVTIFVSIWVFFFTIYALRIMKSGGRNLYILGFFLALPMFLFLAVILAFFLLEVFSG